MKVIREQDFTPALSGSSLRAAIAAIRDSDLSPSEKRNALNALKKLGVDTEYLPHQGKGEMARRVAKNQRAAD